MILEQKKNAKFISLDVEMAVIVDQDEDVYEDEDEDEDWWREAPWGLVTGP